ncbi:hypothetical protein Tco_1393609 [Tanacetum coccineum]
MNETTIRPAAAITSAKVTVDLGLVLITGIAIMIVSVVLNPWLLRENATRNPGPLQFDGPGADSRVLSLCVEDLDYMGRIKKLNEYLEKVRAMVKPGCSQDVAKAALSAMSSVTDILSVMSSPSNSTT